MEWFRQLNSPAYKTYDKNRPDVSEPLRIYCAGAAQSVSLFRKPRRMPCRAISSGRELH
jgi:hypothetical protein